MTIIEQIGKIADEICNGYCKFLGQYNIDDDSEYDKLLKDHCENCPLRRL